MRFIAASTRLTGLNLLECGLLPFQCVEFS